MEHGGQGCRLDGYLSSSPGAQVPSHAASSPILEPAQCLGISLSAVELLEDPRKHVSRRRHACKEGGAGPHLVVVRIAEDLARGGMLESRGVEAPVIGAVALATHGYVRFTEDLDLGVNTDLVTLPQVADGPWTAGYDVKLREP